MKVTEEFRICLTVKVTDRHGVDHWIDQTIGGDYRSADDALQSGLRLMVSKPGQYRNIFVEMRRETVTDWVLVPEASADADATPTDSRCPALQHPGAVPCELKRGHKGLHRFGGGI